MPKNDDELLLGGEVLTSKEATDSDGDGVSDLEEELAGTNAREADADPTRREADPGSDPRLEGLERETVFDPAAATPDGMTIDTGLTGLTNLDGTGLPSGPDHDGIDGIGTSPLAVDRNPLAGVGSTPSAPGSGSAPDIVGGNDMALVSGEADDWNPAPNPAPPPPAPGATPPPDAPPDDERDPEPEPDPDPVPPQVYTDPDAGGGGDGGTPTDADIERAINVRGGDTKPVDGGDGGPQIDTDSPPPPKIDLVRDGGDEGGDLGVTGAPTGRPDAPVVREINPDSGYNPPPSSAGGPRPSGDNTGFEVDHTAAALDGDGLQQMDGSVDVGSVANADLDIDVGLTPEEEQQQQQDEGSFGGPLDDGFD